MGEAETPPSSSQAMGWLPITCRTYVPLRWRQIAMLEKNGLFSMGNGLIRGRFCTGPTHGEVNSKVPALGKLEMPGGWLACMIV